MQKDKIKSNKTHNFSLENPELQNNENYLKDAVHTDQILYWINYARTNPHGFATKIIKQMDLFIDQKMQIKDAIRINTIEGRPAFKEAIQFCQKATPVQPLVINKYLTLAARDHTKSMIANNFFEHEGLDGKGHRERIQRRYGEKINMYSGECLGQTKTFQGPDFGLAAIIGYIVDQGVPNRGHRKNIYNPNFNYVGIYMQSDPENKGFKDTLVFTSDCLNDKAKITEEKQKQSKTKVQENPINKKDINIESLLSKSQTKNQGNQTLNNKIDHIKDEKSGRQEKSNLKEQDEQSMLNNSDGNSKQKVSLSIQKQTDKSKDINIQGLLMNNPYRESRQTENLNKSKSSKIPEKQHETRQLKKQPVLKQKSKPMKTKKQKQQLLKTLPQKCRQLPQSSFSKTQPSKSNHIIKPIKSTSVKISNSTYNNKLLKKLTVVIKYQDKTSETIVRYA